jgi:hypothetical protein
MGFKSENQAGRSMSNSSSKGTALITGAFRGIGAVYADQSSFSALHVVSVLHLRQPRAPMATMQQRHG